MAFDLPGREGVSNGDRLIALPSTGLHTNGYSLARGILFDRLGLDVSDDYPGTGSTVGEVLLRVHRSYLPHLREACGAGWVSALAHITGGGIPGNLSRVLPAGTEAVVDLRTWDPGPVFGFLAAQSGMATDEVFRALNMGIGMIAVARPEHADDLIASVQSTGLEPFMCGEIRAGDGDVRLEAG